MSKTATDTFDFDSLDLGAMCDQPHEFELVHPDTKKGLGVFISVVGSESDTFQKYLRAEQNRTRQEAFKKQRSGKDENLRTVEEDDETVVRALAACITGWRTVRDGEDKPVIYWGGKGLELTTENAVKWMTKFRWVRPQINEQTGELGNFIGG